jgi:hypothetical protein
MMDFAMRPRERHTTKSRKRDAIQSPTPDTPKSITISPSWFVHWLFCEVSIVRADTAFFVRYCVPLEDRQVLSVGRRRKSKTAKTSYNHTVQVTSIYIYKRKRKRGPAEPPTTEWVIPHDSFPCLMVCDSDLFF